MSDSTSLVLIEYDGRGNLLSHSFMVTNTEKTVRGTVFSVFGLEWVMREQRGGILMRVMDAIIVFVSAVVLQPELRECSELLSS